MSADPIPSKVEQFFRRAHTITRNRWKVAVETALEPLKSPTGCHVDAFGTARRNQPKLFRNKKRRVARQRLVKEFGGQAKWDAAVAQAAAMGKN